MITPRVEYRTLVKQSKAGKIVSDDRLGILKKIVRNYA